MSVSNRWTDAKGAKALEKKILAACRGGKLYVDPSFPANSKMLYKRGGGMGKVGGFRRPTEVVQNPRLFVDGVESGDVMQGALGDCWFLGSMSVVATRDDLLYPLFVSAHPEAGFYQIRFFIDGDWRYITIDDQLPVRSDGAFIYSHCADPTEVWVPLMEKAFAKLNGCYEVLASGQLAEGMTDLTGEGGETFNFQDADIQKQIRDGSFWRLLCYFESEKFLMGCSAEATKGREGDTGMGILGGHAYAVLQAVEVKAHGKTVRLLRIRNPWGEKEWRGAWSDNAKEWTPALLKRLNHSFGDDGTFFMCFEDFVRWFNKMTVCRLLGDDFGLIWQKAIFDGQWRGATAAGCSNNPKWLDNPQYALTVKDAGTKVFICLSQPDGRLQWKPQYKMSIGFYVFKADNSTPLRNRANAELIFNPTFINSREFSSSFDLPPGSYIIIPATFQRGQQSNFYLTVYADHKVVTHAVGNTRDRGRSVSALAKGSSRVKQNISTGSSSPATTTSKYKAPPPVIPKRGNRAGTAPSVPKRHVGGSGPRRTATTGGGGGATGVRRFGKSPKPQPAPAPRRAPGPPARRLGGRAKGPSPSRGKGKGPSRGKAPSPSRSPGSKGKTVAQKSATVGTKTMYNVAVKGSWTGKEAAGAMTLFGSGWRDNPKFLLVPQTRTIPAKFNVLVKLAQPSDKTLPIGVYVFHNYTGKKPLSKLQCCAKVSTKREQKISLEFEFNAKHQSYVLMPVNAHAGDEHAYVMAIQCEVPFKLEHRSQ